MNYIVFDLEWNQGDTGQEEPGIPFEIIEIGAVKLDQEGRVAGKFSQLVKPTVYQRMHQATGRLIHLQMKELENGTPFVQTAEGFLEWCGQEPFQFCFWVCLLHGQDSFKDPGGEAPGDAEHLL